MRLLGQLCLLGAFVGTGYAAFACLVGWRNQHRSVSLSGLISAIAAFVALSGTLAVLVHALYQKDFRLAYVADYSSQHLSWYYSLSSLWVGQAGSLLLWSWFSGLLALAFRLLPSREAASLRDPAFAILMGFCCFLTATMVFAADPLAASLAPPSDGAGLSPILQHPAMLIHPPIVFLGYSLWAIPFALAMAALITGRLDPAWTSYARPWALAAWSVLGCGILLGAQWAYEELGWGGYWGWDPVENGSLLPWLLGTTSIHTLMAWRHRGMLKKSALVLTIGTFGMCNFATFLTRSGIFSSLHAFSKSAIGWLFLGQMIALALITVVLLWLRWCQLRSERSTTTLWSRESMVITATITLAALTLIIFLGTVSTAISDLLIARKVVVGVSFYNNALIPSGLVLLTATALAPLLRWGAGPTTPQKRMIWLSVAGGCAVVVAAYMWGIRQPIFLSVAGLSALSVIAFAGALLIETRRQARGNLAARLARVVSSGRRQYGGFVIHMGLFCLALGVAGSSLGTRRHEAVLGPGDSLAWAGRNVRLVEIVERELPDKLVAEAQLEVRQGTSGPESMTPARHFHRRQQEWTTEVDIHSTWRGDLYTILQSGAGEGLVRLTFIENPLMRWIWLGGCVMGAGALLAVWPVKRAIPRNPGSSLTGPARRRRSQVASESAACTLMLAMLFAASKGAPAAKPPSHDSPTPAIAVRFK